MIPGFALDLTHEGIALMHRGKGGWLLVGEVKLDDPDLPTQLAMMRQRAMDLGAGSVKNTGFATKLIIPPSQILFTTMTAPGPDNITRETRIREGLEGLTPYPIEDLVFDWYPDGDMVHVAVVVRETLAEAEGFATENRMNPVCFTARSQGSFTREAFFGKAKSAASFLRKDTLIERDTQSPPELMGTEIAPLPLKQEDKPSQAERSQANDDQKVMDKAATPAVAKTTSGKIAKGSSARLAAFPPEFEPEDKPEQSQPADQAPKAPKQTARVKDTQVKKKPVKAAPAKSVQPLPPAPTPPQSNQVPAFSSRRTTSETTDGSAGPLAASDNATPKPAGTPDKPGTLPNQRIEPRIQISAPSPSAHLPEQVHVPVTAPTVDGGTAAGVPADKDLVADKRQPNANTSKAGNGKATAPGKALLSGARKGMKSAAGAAVGSLTRSKSTSPGRANAKPATTPAAPPVKEDSQTTSTAIAPPPGKRSHAAPSSADAEAMTIFGARAQANQGFGKPKYLGLFLVLGLLLMMGVLAVWSMFFLPEQSAELFPETPDQFETAITTGRDRDAQPPTSADLAGDRPEIPNTESFDQDLTTDINAANGLPQLSPEAAITRYAATGVWERAPDPLADPAIGKADDLYVASIDPAIPGVDAVALPPKTIAALSPAPIAQITRRAPPPKGTRFDLDENGWVRPTADGSLTRNGVMVFAGAPPLAPPLAPEGLFPERVADATPTADAQPPRQPAVRPRVRPDGLIEQHERSLFGGLTRRELAALRPRLRPNNLVIRPPADQQQASSQASAIASAVEGAADAAAAAAAASVIAPTKLAVAQSVAPKPRPRQFNRIIAATRSATDASDGSVAVAAAPRNQVITPKLPTRASVSKQATIKNAIPLRKVALIGISGSSAKRKALVRLASGRYVKVGVGDRLDGGRVVSISESKLIYKKGSRNRTLKILPFS